MIIKPGLAIAAEWRETARQSRNTIMILYRFLTGPDDSAFCHKVSAALSKGWLLQGPPLMTFDPVQGRVICGQAVMKDVKNMDYQADMKLSDY